MKTAVPRYVVDRFFENVYRYNNASSMKTEERFRDFRVLALKTLGDSLAEARSELEKYVGDVDKFFNLPKVQSEYVIFCEYKDTVERGNKRCDKCVNIEFYSHEKKCGFGDIGNLFCANFKEDKLDLVDKFVRATERCLKCENFKEDDISGDCRFDDINILEENCKRMRNKK